MSQKTTRFWIMRNQVWWKAPNPRGKEWFQKGKAVIEPGWELMLPNVSWTEHKFDTCRSVEVTSGLSSGSKCCVLSWHHHRPITAHNSLQSQFLPDVHFLVVIYCACPIGRMTISWIYSHINITYIIFNKMFNISFYLYCRGRGQSIDYGSSHILSFQNL